MTTALPEPLVPFYVALGDFPFTPLFRARLTMAPGTAYSDVLSDWTSVEYLVRGMRNSVKIEIALMNYRPRDGLSDIGEAWRKDGVHPKAEDAP